MAKFTEIYMIMELCDSDLKKLCRQSEYCNFSSPVLNYLSRDVSRGLIDAVQLDLVCTQMSSDCYSYGVQKRVWHSIDLSSEAVAISDRGSVSTSERTTPAGDGFAIFKEGRKACLQRSYSPCCRNETRGELKSCS